jgi:hypothetical protein
MPSDDRIQSALAALGRPREVFVSAVASADEEVRGYRLQQAGAADPGAALGRELGGFAEGRIDPSRLAGLLTVEATGDPLTAGLMGVAHDLFQEIMAADAGGFVVRVPPGGDLRNVVSDALARLGQAFGVSHAVDRARSHRYDPDTDYPLLHAHFFHRWTAKERHLAPPLVVAVRGEDLRAAGLAEFVDGSLKIVLAVEGRTSPAPLARLIAADAFVAQSSDPAVLGALAAHPGAGVVAWTEPGSGAIAFVHDPATGARPWQRLHVDGGVEVLRTLVAEEESRGRSGGAAADLRHLLEIASAPGTTEPVGATAPATGAAADDPADRLAAWLLARTDLKDL